MYARPGHFVIVRAGASGERVPLTVCDSDPVEGTITLIVQAVGDTTRQINERSAGDSLSDVLGPLGEPTDIDSFGTCVVVAGGVGVAIMRPVAEGLLSAGNRVIAVIGARDGQRLVLVEDMRAVCDRVIVTTEDGSSGRRGLVTDALCELMAAEQVDRVFTAGPVGMMAAVADLTRPDRVATIASLNPIMIDGTGMCGGCRVSVGGTSRFACVDGPEFDAHAVDFAALARRNEAYREFEKRRWEETPCGSYG